MAAAKGNKYAEKWNEETALEFVLKVMQYNEDNEQNYHLGLSLIECGGYPELWAYFCNTFDNNSKVFKAIKKVEQLLEARIVNNTINGEAKSAAMSIFYLKNKHGYEDKLVNDNTHKVESTTIKWAGGEIEI